MQCVLFETFMSQKQKQKKGSKVSRVLFKKQSLVLVSQYGKERGSSETVFLQKGFVYRISPLGRSTKQSSQCVQALPPPYPSRAFPEIVDAGPSSRNHISVYDYWYSVHGTNIKVQVVPNLSIIEDQGSGKSQQGTSPIEVSTTLGTVTQVQAHK